MTQLDQHGAQILAFIERYQRQHHRSPSYEEIGSAIGLASKDHVSRDLKRLQQMGYLSLTPRLSRSIVLSKKPRPHGGSPAPAIPLPIVGSLETRAPIAQDDGRLPPLDWITIGRELIDGERDAEVLQVKGESMVDALVHQGDLVVIKRKDRAENGEFVVVWIKPENRLGLKYFYHENGRVRLEPANPELPPEHYKASDVQVQGQVLAVVRTAG